MSRWVVVTAHPSRPSPYFTVLDRWCAGSTDLDLEFAPSVWAVDGPPGVVNLHRLKRLYRGPDGGGTATRALGLIRRLRAMQRGGWRVVWTFHNLYPVDQARQTLADRIAAWGVASTADVIITHTESDALWWRARMPRSSVLVGGWGGMPGVESAVPADLGDLVGAMRDVPFPCLLFGNDAPYKGIVNVARTFASAAPNDCSLFVVGPMSPPVLNSLESLAPKVVPLARRVPHEFAGHLYDAAAVALCPYRSDGPFRFFRRTLFPSSVATAVGFDVPVVAPRLPAVAEIAAGVQSILYSEGGLRDALTRLIELPDTRGRRLVQGDAGWERIRSTYESVARGHAVRS